MVLSNEKRDKHVASHSTAPYVRGSKTPLVKTALLLSSVALLSTIYPVSWTPTGLFTARAPSQSASTSFADPAEEWKDDVWPLREQTPWDISTDFPFPRKLEYDVTEGTWLRLDVHPKTGEVIFDLLGDIYCLPAGAYSASTLASGAHTRAVPVLKGIPHDSDPHFSPDGTQFVFRSDAGLGVENIWVKPWNGCEASDIRPPHATGDMADALRNQNLDEELLASGVQESAERKHHRLLREGRHDAQRVTNETYRWVSDARFHPDGSKVVATKWYTSSRSLGAGEAWEYDIPKDASASSIQAGSGKRLVGRTLPLGWSVENYGEQQVGPEQFIWKGNDTLIYSKNVRDTNGRWQYSKDVHSGINAIFTTNITSKQTTILVDANSGGATRSELSRDGRTLAFVRRVRDKEALVLKDLESGTLRNIWYGLTYDLSIVSAPMGAYPAYAFTPEDDAIIIWAAGKVYHVPLQKDENGERIAGGEPQVIPFQAHIEKRLAETRSTKTDIKTVETADTQRVHAFHELRIDETGEHAVFQAGGATYVQKVEGSGKHYAQPVPVHDSKAPYYSPSFVPGHPDLVIHARWSDVEFTTLELANLTSGTAHVLTGLPLGRYYSPILCACPGSNRKIAFLRKSGDYLTGDVVATAGAGLYIGELTLPSGSHEKVSVKNIKFVPSEIDTDDVLTTQLRFLEKSKKLLVSSPRRAFVIDLAAGPDEDGQYKHETLATGRTSAELAVPPPSLASLKKGETPVAIVDFHHVYYAPAVTADDAVWSRPANATKGLQRLSVDGGHSITWSGDGSKLFWLLGPYLHHVDISKLSACVKAAQKDTVNFGVECTKSHPKYEEIVVEYPSDISRLKEEAAALAQAKYGDSKEANSNADFFILSNATLVTMSTGNIHNDILHDAVLVTRNGEIEAIAGVHDFVAPYGATVLDAQGAGFVVPGFIDVHAHWNGFDTAIPARSWELETFLAYGVTTLHNPSADTVLAFAERFRVERGQLVGPRIFQTGTIIYGAGAPVYHEDVVSLEDAKSALLRIKAEGGPSSFSYKNYNLPIRASRQRLLLAARKLGMLCVPEGGMNYDWDLTYIIDGMTTIEHPLPIPVLYDDVLNLYALSGTGSTPTHIVNYGGVMGEQLIWATEDLPNNEKLRRFVRHDGLESLSESTARPKLSYQAFNTSISTAKMIRKGLKAHIGAHGEPPLGVNYHAEMWYTQSGGLTNYETLRAATSDAAITLGIDNAVGSLTPGKLADFVVYPPGVDLLEGDISGTRDIRFVARGGRVFDATTLTEIWPVKGRKEPLPPINAD
ncbi:hypothetical protein DICSQDRAFT_57465 [Dichomitus squalens LYAD-421 SS1]|uniref:uncharacterized protein n=1 Tax=Dichomitus squalens (strain LYAD-421) TaxID=732165 RepID=UPI00044132DE|nr:uncharacterized protein DICSQDRAFT_57465 [Dichomitus squalens LYAD-421 SS1]EJF62664.1 hypothetical protein DICSQDRAFT_57465 [Dichomitus squalens LYAD-421 SS1]